MKRVGKIITAGVDVGSSAIKVVIVESTWGGGRERSDAKILAKSAERMRRREQNEVFDLAMSRALEDAKIARKDIEYLATTGEGQHTEGSTGHFYGMTAHARGAVFLEPEVRAACDVGALHARAIRFDDKAKVLDYRMTSQCASGTGQFLENISRYLGVTLGEIGPLSLQGTAPERVSGICAVLAETDVINMVSRGITTPNILKGIHESMATGFAKLLKSAKTEGTVLVTGGLSADVGLLEELRGALNKIGGVKFTVKAHPDGIYAGAIGAALWGAYRHEVLVHRAEERASASA